MTIALRNATFNMRCFLIILFPFVISSKADAHDTLRRTNRWIPDHIKAQFAGGIGFVSLGAGYENKKENIQADILYGYVPASVGGIEIHTVTGKFTWLPMKVVNWKTVQLRPLSAGLLFSYTAGDQYFLFNPENYPLSYYQYPTALTIGFFLGGQVQKILKNNIQLIGFYYELGTNEKAISNYILNHKTIGLNEIFHLGIGVRYRFK